MIKENCCCGAIFEAKSYSPTFEQYRYNEFLEAHKVCRDKYSDAVVNIITPEDSKRIADTLIEQINSVTYQMQMDFMNMTHNISNIIRDKA